MQFIKAISEGGVDSATILRRETANRVLTEKRIELLREIADEPPESMRALARRVDRDIIQVRKDLVELHTANLIDIEEVGRSKRPTLSSPNIFVEPIVFDGEVIEDDDNTPDYSENLK